MTDATPNPIDHRARAADLRDHLSIIDTARIPSIVAARAALATAHEAAAMADMLEEIVEHFRPREIPSSNLQLDRAALAEHCRRTPIVPGGDGTVQHVPLYAVAMRDDARDRIGESDGSRS